MVFDCASGFSDVALNDHPSQGSDLRNGMLGVLVRFRRGRIAISADIKAMFHQVQVDFKDWDALTFLWWPNKRAVEQLRTVFLLAVTQIVTSAL